MLLSTLLFAWWALLSFALTGVRGGVAPLWLTLAIGAALAAPAGRWVRRQRESDLALGANRLEAMRRHVRFLTLAGLYIYALHSLLFWLAGPGPLAVWMRWSPLGLAAWQAAVLFCGGVPVRTGDRRRCSACRYEYCPRSESPEDRCPECGALWNAPGGTIDTRTAALWWWPPVGVAVALGAFHFGIERGWVMEWDAYGAAGRISTDRALINSIGTAMNDDDSLFRALLGRPLAPRDQRRLAGKLLSDFQQYEQMNWRAATYVRRRLIDSRLAMDPLMSAITDVRIGPAASGGPRRVVRVSCSPEFIRGVGFSTGEEFGMYVRLILPPGARTVGARAGGVRFDDAGGAPIACDGREGFVDFEVEAGPGGLPRGSLGAEYWLVVRPWEEAGPHAASTDEHGEPRWPEFISWSRRFVTGGVTADARGAPAQGLEPHP